MPVIVRGLVADFVVCVQLSTHRMVGVENQVEAPPDSEGDCGRN
jgi:hypothetical protein